MYLFLTTIQQYQTQVLGSPYAIYTHSQILVSGRIHTISQILLTVPKAIQYHTLKKKKTKKNKKKNISFLFVLRTFQRNHENITLLTKSSQLPCLSRNNGVCILKLPLAFMRTSLNSISMFPPIIMDTESIFSF